MNDIKKLCYETRAEKYLLKSDEHGDLDHSGDEGGGGSGFGTEVALG